MPLNLSGRYPIANAVNGSVPGPTLKWREGDTITIAVTNRLKVPTSIHWHGIRLPADMDGVPGVSFAGIPAGETFIYRIPVVQSGTYWYPCRSHFQEQIGLIGAVEDAQEADHLSEAACTGSAFRHVFRIQSKVAGMSIS